MQDNVIMDFARLARMLAKHSPCKRRGVSCVIFDPADLQIVGWGVNGPARNRICSGEKDNCGCLHSEVNTILNSHPKSQDNFMICSRAPCVPCASVIVNSGFITKVFVLDESEPGAHGIGVLKSANLLVDFISCPDGAEIGLRDASMKPSEIGSLDLVALKHELSVNKEKLKYAMTSGEQSELLYRNEEIEKKIKQIS